MAIKAILFDKDGTLLDFAATFAPATARVIDDLVDGDRLLEREVAKVLKFDLSTGIIDPGSVTIAGSLDDIAAVLMPHIKATSVAELSDRVNALFIKYSLITLQPFDFLAPTIAQLAATGLALGVATNDSEKGAYAHMEAVGLVDQFCFIAGYDSGFGAKPKPGMVFGFADHLSLAPKEIMMVGDSSHDCDAGRAAGAIAIGVTSGGATAEELAPHADYVLPSIAELHDLIAKLNA